MSEEEGRIRHLVAKLHEKLDTLSEFNLKSLVEVRWAAKTTAQILDLAKALDTNVQCLDRASKLRYMPPFPKRTSDVD